MRPAAIEVLSMLFAPPDWLTWARPATEREHAARGIDLVLTLDLGRGAADLGVARVGVCVRWMGETVPVDIATWRVAPGETAFAPFVRWAKDIRRQLQRRQVGRGPHAEGEICVWPRRSS